MTSAEFQFPPDSLMYLHYGPASHPPRVLPPSSATQLPVMQSSSPVIKTFTANSIGRWSEQRAATSGPSMAAVYQEPAWRKRPVAEILAQPLPALIDAVIGNRSGQLAHLLNNPEVVAHIDAEDETGRSALDHALERRNFSVARQLVRQGAKVADDMALDPGLLIDLIAAGETHLALEVAKLCMKMTGDFHHESPEDLQRWQLPLFMAIRVGNVGLVRQLANSRTMLLRDRLGGNALHFAAHSPDPMLLAGLLARLPNQARQRSQILDAVRTDGHTPLMQGVIANQPSSVAALLRAGALVDAIDEYGDTALHMAARAGHLEIGRLLLAAGARTNVRNRSGQDPDGIAEQNGRPEFNQLLRAFSVQD